MKTFNELTLIEPLQRALAEENYQTPTAIQARTIPAALEGCDILGCAQTGTGKTAAFAIPILDALGSEPCDAAPGRPYVLVLAPTRELAIQIGESFNTYGRHLDVQTCVIFGGVNQQKQVRELRRGAHVVVATPGRLLDLINQGHIDLDCVDTFVLDEADRMLDMGFLPDLKRIIALVPEDRQSLFFSATLPPKITEFAKRLLVDPVRVNVTPKSKSVDKIAQQIVFTDRGEKPSLLKEILVGESVQLAIVFTRTKRGANTVEKRLKKQGIRAGAIHGNKSQAARQRTLDAFRRGSVRVLVATDVAARGIDIDDITHVVNYDLPTDPESYVHRVGRTGRAGASGTAITFCLPDEQRDLQAIEKLIGKSIAKQGTRASQPAPAGRPAGKSRPSRRRGGSNRNRNRGRSSSGRAKAPQFA